MGPGRLGDGGVGGEEDGRGDHRGGRAGGAPVHRGGGAGLRGRLHQRQAQLNIFPNIRKAFDQNQLQEIENCKICYILYIFSQGIFNTYPKSLLSYKYSHLAAGRARRSGYLRARFMTWMR